MKTIAERLKHARESRGWSQSHLAVAAGKSQSTIGNIEANLREGRASLPQIAKALGISHEWLADGEGEMHAHVGVSTDPQPAGSTVVPMMAYWPFSKITRSQWESLADNQKEHIESSILMLIGAPVSKVYPRRKAA